MAFRFSPCEPCCNSVNCKLFLRMPNYTATILSQTHSTSQLLRQTNIKSSGGAQQYKIDKIPSYFSFGPNKQLGVIEGPLYPSATATVDGCDIDEEIFYSSLYGNCNIPFEDVVDTVIDSWTRNPVNINNYVMWTSFGNTRKYRPISKSEIFQKSVSVTPVGCSNPHIGNASVAGFFGASYIDLKNFELDPNLVGGGLGFTDKITGVNSVSFQMKTHIDVCSQNTVPITNIARKIATVDIRYPYSMYDTFITNLFGTPFSVYNDGTRRRLFGPSRPWPTEKLDMQQSTYGSIRKKPYYILMYHNYYENGKWNNILLKQQEVDIKITVNYDVMDPSNTSTFNTASKFISATVETVEDKATSFSVFLSNEDIRPTSSNVSIILVDSKDFTLLPIHQQTINSNIIGTFVFDYGSLPKPQSNYTETGTGRLYKWTPEVLVYAYETPTNSPSLPIRYEQQIYAIPYAIHWVSSTQSPFVPNFKDNIKVKHNIEKFIERCATIMQEGGMFNSSTTIIYSNNNEVARVQVNITEDSYSLNPEDGIKPLPVMPRPPRQIQVNPPYGTTYTTEECIVKKVASTCPVSENNCWTAGHIWYETIDESIGQMPIGDMFMSKPDYYNNYSTVEFDHSCPYIIYS